MSSSKVKDRVPTLLEYAQKEGRTTCRVCQLSIEIRRQIGRPASEQGISRGQQVRWLQLVSGVEIMMNELIAHVNERHDEGN